jgi:hypothetical protein
MIHILSLWLPILVSAVFVFIASSVIHMFLKYHQTDFKKIPHEDDVMDQLGAMDIPPGNYYFPYAGSMEAMRSEEFIEKRRKGPVAFITVLPSGPPTMTSELIQWFLYCVLVGVFVAYVTGHAVGVEADYLDVFRFAGATAFAGYFLAQLQNTIWYHTPWLVTLKNAFDGLVYALITAGTFGWLWP